MSQANNPCTVAFFGLGHMGGPMALNLKRAGFKVQGFDLSERARSTWAQQGIDMASSAEQAVQGADIVLSMLPHNEAVLSLYLGASGVLHKIKAGALILDCSTISAQAALQLHAAAQERDLACLDAPVSGGTAGAQAGTLTFMVGGTPQHLERARAVLQAMGKNIFHAGAAGAGQTAKICNNMLLSILMVGTAEALNLGCAHGLDPKVLSDIMRVSSGGNWALEKYNPLPGVMDNVPASKGYQGGFGTDLMLKDLTLAQDSALRVNASTPLGAMTRNLYAMHSQAGQGALDFSSIIQLLMKKQG